MLIQVVGEIDKCADKAPREGKGLAGRCSPLVAAPGAGQDGGKSERELQQARLGPRQLGDCLHTLPSKLLVRAAATPLSLLWKHLLPLLQLEITACSCAGLRGAGASV